MKQVIEYTATEWNDCVGGKIQADVHNSLTYASNCLVKINQAFDSAVYILNKQVRYTSRESALRSCKVVVNL